MSRNLLLSILFFSSASLFFDIPQPFKLISGLLQVFVFPGLLFTGVFMKSVSGDRDRMIFALMISPIILALVILGLDHFIADVHLSAVVAVLSIYILFASNILIQRHRYTESGREVVPPAVFLVSLAFAGILLFSYVYNRFLLIHSDSWYHASVINEIINRGIPPKEPWLADFPIRYMWIYHLLIAAFKQLSGVSVFWAMSCFNLLNAFCFPYLISRYISSFTDKRRTLISVPLFAIAGLGAVSWIFFPTVLLKLLHGEVRGADEMQRILSGVVIDGSRVIHTLTPFGTWMVNFYDKFITITAFSYSLNLFILALIVALNRDFLKNHGIRFLVTLYFILLGTVIFHTVTGMTTILAFAGAGTLIAMFGGRFLEGGGSCRKGSCIFIAAASLAAITIIPYMLSLGIGAGQGQGSMLTERLHFSIKGILTMVLPLLVLYRPARKTFRRLIEERDHEAVTIFSLVAVLVPMAVLVDLPASNESKLIFPLFIIIGPLVFIEVTRSIVDSSGIRRILILLLVCALFLFPLVLTARGYILQRPSDDIQIRRSNITDKDKELFEWIRANAPENSVFIEDNIYHLLPVYAGRRNFYSTQDVIRILDYSGEKMKDYGLIQSSLFGEGELEDSTIMKIRDMDEQVYIVIWSEDLDDKPWLEERFSENSGDLERVFDNERAVIYRIRENGS